MRVGGQASEGVGEAGEDGVGLSWESCKTHNPMSRTKIMGATIATTIAYQGGFEKNI